MHKITSLLLSGLLLLSLVFPVLAQDGKVYTVEKAKDLLTFGGKLPPGQLQPEPGSDPEGKPGSDRASL